MVVGCVHHCSRIGQTVCQVHTRAEVKRRGGHTIAVITEARVHPEVWRQLHGVLQISADLASCLSLGKCDGAAIRFPKVHMRQSQEVGKGDVAFAVKKQVLIRAQHYQIHSAFHGMASEEPRQIAFQTGSEQLSIVLGYGRQRIVCRK